MHDGNLLLHGDNLLMLRRFVADASVDLVYVDPPFNSGGRYALLRDGTRPAGTGAFDDAWRWSDELDSEWAEVLERADDRLRPALLAFQALLGPSSLLAYLLMMAPRLVELRRALAAGGSIYLHCDGSASHYLKVLMDAVFGRENFLNNVVWLYGLGGSSPRRWPRKHDDILWYSRTPDGHHFEAARVAATSQRLRGRDKKAPDWWDIPALNNMAAERTGYPTQKPEALLERIVQSSSGGGQVVLDPCCGSGTTLVVSQRLGRRWIGIDSAAAAIEQTVRRLGRASPGPLFELIDDRSGHAAGTHQQECHHVPPE